VHPYPHTYLASASAESTGLVAVTSPQSPSLETAAPPQFDGPGGVWSPETLLCASLADCFVLTFRAVARAAKFEWLHLDCRVEGVLERLAQRSEFTRYTTIATLTVPAGVDTARAHQLLERAERGCLIANSVRGERVLKAEIIATNAPAAPRVAEPSELVL
jgi:organic hydroperoxide reductase OsmC/OhrA